MRIRAKRDPRREAFTLIELVIVIGIIAILASLTAAAAIKVLSKKPEVSTRSELSQLDAGPLASVPGEVWRNQLRAEPTGVV